jgi:valyl-tRNA synthetase
MDWEKRYFTLDTNQSAIVKQAFIELYKQGLVYRARKMVSWSCYLQTTISDMEVDFLPIEKRTLMSFPGYSEK